MGDMKTPDFDDLLAAFDIPDIEAIQSSPEEDPDVSRSSADVRESGSPSGFPGSHVDPPVVSVIVKNIVRPEPFDELEKSVRDENKAESPPSSSRDPRGPDPHFSYLGPKLCAGSLPQVPNGVEGSVPAAQVQSSPELWSLRSPPTSTPNVNEMSGLVRLKPTLHPQPSISAGPSATISPPSSTPSSPHTGSPLLPPPLTRMDEIGPFQNPPMSPLSQNGAIRVGTLYMDEEDSEPDLGSPLVIQESPESVLSSPPKFTQRATPPELRRSTETSSSHVLSSLPSVKLKPHYQRGQPTTSRSPSVTTHAQSPKDSLPAPITSSTLVQEKYPDHVIDERDSPESPPPSETGFVVPKRSSSPESALTAPPASNHKDFDLQEDLRETELSLEGRPKKMKTGDGAKTEEENCGSSSLNAVSAGAAKKVLSAPRRLKVKIKTPAGNITRTVSGVAPKRGARASSKSEDGSKPSPARRNVKTKRQVSQPSRDCIKAVLEGVRVVKDKTTKDTKPKLSTTAVNITKTTSLPSVTPSPRVGSGAIHLHSQGQRAGSASSSLLSSQSCSKPASIVNSTGAIISRSQTNLVEAFNKILNNKNLLPSYKPDLSSPLPAEWGLPLPEQGYRCLECGDAFALEQSLARHYDRRSLRIEVTCNHCAKRLAFFNKCSLLLHAREHKEKGLVMQCSHLVMKPVPVEQMIGLQEPKPAAQTSSSLRQAAANPAPQSHHATSSKKAEEVRYTSNKCPECQVQFSSSEEVADHFQEIKAAHSTSCTECSPPMLLPNSCSAGAHQRVHQAGPPHICPECGGTAKQPIFQSHLDDTCLHFARRIGYKCSSCLVVFGGLNAVKSHIQQAHCDMFHKCPSCPMAFKSSPSIQNHITAQHPTLTGAQATLIYKCVMCDTVFTHKTLLYTHFDTHLANQKVSVFKCPECTKIFSLRNSLMEHFKSHQAPTLKQELPPSPAAPCPSRPSVKTESSEGEEGRDQEEERVNGERMKAPSGWKCVPCHARYTVREDFITHMAEQHGKILKKFPCNKCESSFTTTSSMRRHIRDKHKATSRNFHCRLCPEGGKTFSSEVLLESHMRLRHSADGVNEDTLMGGGGQLDEVDSSSEQDGSFGTRQRRRGAVKVEHEEESMDTASPAKKLRPTSSSTCALGSSPQPESGFRCSPCGFTTEDQAAFLDHISQHRPVGTEGVCQQCLQCGACFTSSSSLSRHRFITHKVRNVLPDNQQTPCEPPAPSPGNSRSHDDRSPLEGSVPASPSSQTSISQGKEDETSLACKVCRKQFDKASDLNTHFRTHGMAFINARNAGKST
ncbi:zinc finger protein 687a [Genypterus blacodes]|uniref:zinc finger protein 687a n=1 Tax=Genypterus blacodes TaxID=154954 RepID=UPI003F76602F